MIDKSFISVADHQYDDPLSYESSRSSEFYSDEPDDEHRIKPLSKSVHVKMNSAKNKDNEDYMSDSKNSDDQFLECESDYDLTSRHNNPFVDYETLVDIYRESKNIESKRNISNGKGDSSPVFDNQDVNMALALESQRLNRIRNRRLGAKGGDAKNSQCDLDLDDTLDNRLADISQLKFKGKENLELGADKLERNSSFSDQMYDVAVSDMGSDVNSEIESRILEYHEAKKNKSFVYDEDMNSQDLQDQLFKPEDEVDELFDRVINGGFDPDFTFNPEPLDPYVKMSKKLLSKKHRLNAENNKKRDSGNTETSGKSKDKDKEKDFLILSSSPTTTPLKQPSVQSSPNVRDSPVSSAEGEGTKVDPSLVQLIPIIDPVVDLTQKSEDISKSSDSSPHTPKLEKTKKLKEFEDSIKTKQQEQTRPSFPILRQKSRDIQLDDSEPIKTDSEVEKEKERARVLFEKTKFDDSFYRRRTDEDVSKGLKVLKLREDKRSKKSKHHKSDTDTEDDKNKKDKKSDEKGSKSSSSKGEKSDEKSEKTEKSKEKKSEKSKKSSWKSNDYDIIFSSLGECFSSGLIELDSKPIILSKRGFYTMFFRNSKYPYDSTIDFYLFRIGFKYMLVNESSSHNFNLDDVVDYGNFRIKLSGNINLSPNVTKMALIYSNSERQTLEFSLTPSAFDSKPKIMYKLFYSGPLQSVPMPLKFRRRLRVLSLDNSENLGTSVIGALYLLEKKLSELKKKKINLADYFDYICGTGAGALIALCMVKGYSMKDLRSQWNLIVSSLFRWTYSLPSGIIFDYYYIEEFKKNFINILGTDFICSKPWPHCMVTCTNVRSNPYELFLFRNYGDSKFGSLYGTSYAPMWLVGWASCALPTYVRGPSNSHLNSFGYNMINKTQLVDGSLVSSSPSLISLQELTSIYNINLRSLVKDNMDLFLSVGTSKSENDNASINSSTWQILMNCKNLMYNTQLQHLHVKNLFDEYENKYHRIQLPIYPGCKHGKTSKEAVDAVLTSTIQFISRHDNQRIEQIVNILNQ